MSDNWLAAPATLSEVRNWIASSARLARQTSPAVGEDVNRPGPFATALSAAVFGASRADTLLNNLDIEYYLPLRDAAEIPASNRADVAMLVRDGYLPVLPDATLRPREPMSRAHVLRTISRLLQGRALLQLQKGTAKAAANGTFILRSNKGKDLPIQVRADAYLFRQLGGEAYQVSSVALVGGETVTFHVNSCRRTRLPRSTAGNKRRLGGKSLTFYELDQRTFTRTGSSSRCTLCSGHWCDYRRARGGAWLFATRD